MTRRQFALITALRIPGLLCASSAEEIAAPFD
jgi:hypothetical protein